MAQRFEGKNLEEALDAASQGLGVQRYQLTYHVLLEKRGFLGGMKHVMIEAEVNQAATPDEVVAAAEQPPARPAARDTAAPQGGRAPHNRGGRGGRGRGNDRGGRGGRAGGDDRPPRPRRNEEELQSGDFGEFAFEIPEQGAESDSATAVRQWCEHVIELSKLDLQVRTEENETQILLRLYGGDGRRMVDRHGELLDALQVLANKAMTGRKTEKDIELDCQDFKGKRTGDLEEKAKRLADQVRRDGREQLLPAMTPIERRIVHLALRDDAEVTTESRGEGFFKRVAIIRRPPQQDQPSAS